MKAFSVLATRNDTEFGRFPERLLIPAVRFDYNHITGNIQSENLEVRSVFLCSDPFLAEEK
jgi:hypothetical protein